MYFVRRIGLDVGGRIDRVEWQRGDPQTRQWVGDPVTVPVIDVVDRLQIENVGTVFWADGHTVLGPNLHTVVDHRGVESVETLPTETPGRTLMDMPRL